MRTLLAWAYSIGRQLRGLLARALWLRGRLVEPALTVASAFLVAAFFKPPREGWVAFLLEHEGLETAIEAFGAALLVFSGLELWVTLRTALVLERLPPLTAASVAAREGEASPPATARRRWSIDRR